MQANSFVKPHLITIRMSLNQGLKRLQHQDEISSSTLKSHFVLFRWPETNLEILLKVIAVALANRSYAHNGIVLITTTNIWPVDKGLC